MANGGSSGSMKTSGCQDSIHVGGYHNSGNVSDPIDLATLVASSYPGRASMAPVLDLLMTLMHLGKSGWNDLLQTRERLYGILKEELLKVALHWFLH